MNNKSNQISFSDVDVFIGLDVHLKSWKVSIIVDNVMYKTFSQDPDANQLCKYLRKHFPDGNYFSAYEAGFSGFSLHRSLVDLGIQNIVVNPADIPTTDKENRQKEDKRDSRKIARSLRNRELTAIYIPSRNMEELRSLVRYRKRLVEDISRQKTRIKSFLHFHGIKIPVQHITGSRHWSSRFTKWLQTIELTTDYGVEVLKSSVDMVSYQRKVLLEINRKLTQIAKQGTYAKQIHLLSTIPGIGQVVALTLLTELEDINRFKSLDKLCSFVGLIPTTNSSGEKERTGRVTYRSNQALRAVLVESAWVAIRHDPVLSYAYHKFCKRMKPNMAIIKVTKKLLSRIRYVMKNEKKYQFAMN